ncbi:MULTISPECIES: NF038122 family metalloprotease [Bradyrhizobium]|uniref:NF038122 family metalloprotease n=1 Tax=Bradyrhizobium TaxID=374 RepID=UPI001EDAE9FB|nr:NF038122 family metalloprotease [Bradyrhizobium zhengyangense]MCG2643575.1 NF038122 family metalloprotease [Bradyrhizobium zhengyangense]
MNSKTAQDDLLSDDLFYTVTGRSIAGSYIPVSSGSSSSSGSVSGSSMSVSSGGITINLILDAAAQAAPASFKSGLQQAVAIMAANITDKITVNINIDYSGTGGGAAAGPDSGYYENYSWVRSELINNASAGDTTFANLPTGSSIQGQSNVAVWNAELKLWGVIGANDTTTDDGSATFATDINSNLLVGVALHELTHALGRVPYGSAPDVFDFYRFASPGVRLFSGGATAPAAYFSLDGGSTKLADYGQYSDPSDFLNTGVQGANDPFNEYYTGSTAQGLTGIDLKQLAALGFHLTSNTPVVMEAFGLTELVRAGGYYFLDPVSGGTGPELKYAGSGVVAGQSGTWAPIGTEQVGGGFEVVWKNAAADQYTIWTTDSGGNFLSLLAANVSGTSSILENLETTFHQDLNGDGVTGPITRAIEAFGSTTLEQVGANYFLNPAAGGTGPELKYAGSAVAAGQSSTWAPIGAEQVVGGFEVVWKNAAADQYTIWTTDSGGNFLSLLAANVSGMNSTLENLETAFHQDLNGDGVTGPVTTVIEAVGSTALVQVGSNYFLNPLAGGTGPELSNAGAAVVAGQAGTWAPIAAEQTAGGFDVAWKNAAADQYTIWTTDSGGNFLALLAANVSGTSSALVSLSATFHQNLSAASGISANQQPASPTPSGPQSPQEENFSFRQTTGTSHPADVNELILSHQSTPQSTWAAAQPQVHQMFDSSVNTIDNHAVDPLNHALVYDHLVFV